MRYRVYSSAGEDFGTWEGATPAHALASLHRDAGYDVHVDDTGELIFPDEDTRDLCGDVSDWDIVEQSTGRPALPQAERRSARSPLRIPLTEGERALLREVVGDAPLATWAREILLREAEAIARGER